MLDENWKAGSGIIVIWHAMDKNGKIAFMLNNCFGGVPKQLLRKENLETRLDLLSEYVYEESSVYSSYPENKKGSFYLDYYSSFIHLRSAKLRKIKIKEDLINNLNMIYESRQKSSDLNLAINKGLFVYHAVEGTYEGEDTVVGYDGSTKMGDYYRFLVPTKYATIEDFPVELRDLIAVSNTLDFTQDRILDKNIDEYFECD
ncbi:hypothetical protein VQ643_14995 [Pseudomonas sp. F1_0610]|uniref:hypothetical protein n=1 Tax=Pseudomonas sp. F1_0610 TaxID=3114284 RepID=UPI0039C00CE1